MDYPIGKRLTQIRPMTKEELNNQYWTDRSYNRPMAMEFEDGTVIFAAKDEEINGPGVFFGTTPEHGNFRIHHSL
jgi:hypothetical protein